MKKLEKHNVVNIIDLTPIQEGMLFHYLKESGSDQYFEQFCFGITGKIYEEIFKKAWSIVTETNEILRTVFRWEKIKNPVQIILKKHEPNICFYDFTGQEDLNKELAIEDIKINDRGIGFDLSEVPFRVILCKKRDDQYVMIISIHHILYDGWSNAIVLKEFLEAYDGLSHVQSCRIPHKSQFQDFVKLIKDQDKDKQILFWKEYLQGFDSQTKLSPIKTNVRNGKHENFAIKLSKDMLDRFAKENFFTLAALIYTAWGIILQRYNDVDDVIFGTTVSGRSSIMNGIEDIVGPFINTIPFRVKTDADETIINTIGKTESALRERQEYEHTALSDIKRVSGFKGTEELFDNIIVIENYPVDTNTLKKDFLLKIGSYSVFEKTNYDLTVGVTLFDEIEVCFSYDSGLYDRCAIEQLAYHFQNVIKRIIENPGMKISELEILSDEEKQQVIYEFNQTYGDFNEFITVNELFEKRVAQSTDSVAIVHRDKHVTYRELNEKANGLANVLINKGVNPEDTVCIITERSVEMIVGIIAILKAGGAYVPIDPDYPEERIRFILGDSNARVLLTQKNILDKHSGIQNGTILSENILLLDDSKLFTAKTANPPTRNTSKNSFGIIYTSGTTGDPKGIILEHRNVVNLINWFGRTFRMQGSVNLLQLTNYCFDVSIEDFFGALVYGATLYIADKDLIFNKKAFCEYIENNNIQLLNFIPTILRELLTGRKLKGLDTVISGGERLDESLNNELLELGYTLYNNYGPAEGTVDTLSHRCTKNKVLLGKPITNVRCYILDKYNHPVPLGIVGELNISGAGVARGYLNRPKLTKEKFVPNPFIENDRIYKTGDLARWFPDGSIEFIGRKDHQVKLRGYRIELDEIRCKLLEHDEIEDAVVINYEDISGKTSICAYVVSNKQLDISILREYLIHRVPDYMVPSIFMQIEKIPLTLVGKVDRQALPVPNLQSSTSYIAPRNEFEEKLTDIWSSVLGIGKDRIGVEDNFFALGGDSILSIQIAGKAMQFGINISVNQLFQYQTISELAAVAEKQKLVPEKEDALQAIDSVLLTPIQKWFFEQDFKNFNHWNQAVMLETSASIRPELLMESFGLVVKNHDSFKLRYTEQHGIWNQTYVTGENDFSFEMVDLSDATEHQRSQLIEEKVKTLHERLDISAGPLLGAGYFYFGREEKGRLFIAVHHLIIDGYSWRVILEELQDIYGRLDRGLIADQSLRSLAFGKWAHYLYEYANSESVINELTYWLSHIPSSINPIPIDYSGGMNTEEFADTINVVLSKESTTDLLYHIQNKHLRIDEILLAALSCTMGEWAGSFLVDIEGHGREKLLNEYDVSHTVGWFTSVYPMLLGDVTTTSHISDLLRTVKERIRGVPNRGIGYGLLRYLTEEKYHKQLCEKPKAEISFNYMGQFDQVLGKGDLFELTDENSGQSHYSKASRSHLIEVDLIVSEGTLKVSWKYCTNVHSSKTIQNLASSYVDNLTRIISYCKSENYYDFVPSDFSLTNITQAKLDELVGKYNNIQDIYPVSPVQQSMIFHHLYSPLSSVTLEQTVFTVHTFFNTDIFQQVWQTILDRHSSLRASYHWEGLDESVQVIHQNVDIPFKMIDWSEIPPEKREYELERFIEEDRNTLFDFSKPPLMRVSVIKHNIDDFTVIWTHHHLQLDGWCVNIILNEVGKLYNSLSAGNECELENLPSFKEYIKWLKRQDINESEKFWRRVLQGFRTPISIKNLLPSKATSSKPTAFGRVVYEIPEEVHKQLDSITKKNRITLNTLVQGAWAILISRYANEDDIVFGATSSGRPVSLPKSSSMLGCFMNTVPMRIRVDPAAKVILWLQAIQINYANIRQFEHTPLAFIRSWSEVARNSALYDLYESIVIIENYPFDLALMDELNSLKIEFNRVEEQLDYPLTLYCNLHPTLHFNLLYDCRYFDESAANQILLHLVNIIKNIVDKGDCFIDEISMLEKEETRRILFDWNSTFLEYPQDMNFCDLFEKQVAIHPDNLAVIQDTEKITYKELESASNKLAHRLAMLGIVPDIPVAMIVDRSINLIIGIMGILKAGGAFLPIDPEYPAERIRLMLEDAGSPVLLTQNDLIQKASGYSGSILCIDNQLENDISAPNRRPNSGITPENLAYVIYTSGSSGKPKGVLMPHKAVVSHSIDMIERYELTSSDHVLQFSSIGFDITLEQIFSSLASGATLVLRDIDIWEPLVFARRCSELGVTVANIPTTYWHQAVVEWTAKPEALVGTSFRLVVVGGEQMLPERVVQWMRLPLLNVRLLNAYGPAETAMTSTLYELPANFEELHMEFVPVGRPLANRCIYILDEQMKPVPVGAKGELYIGGIPVARGYLNRTELTRQRFVKNPFINGFSDRMYQTGDIGRFMPDGNIQVLGRKDGQVKVRGHRVELGEVEAALNAYSFVKDAVAIVKDGGQGDKYLVAFYVTLDHHEINPDQYKNHLASIVPEYMVPAHFIRLNSIPLNDNGKVDRKVLEHYEFTIESTEEYKAPSSNTEKRLTTIWKAILGLERIGVRDNFFELGGNSLKAIILISKIHQEFNTEIPLARIFETPTVEEISNQIDTGDKSQYISMKPMGEKEYYEVSPAQKRLYIVNQMNGIGTSYNIPLVMHIEGNVNIERLELAFKSLVDRHETLRTSFEIVNGQIYQKVNENVDFSILYEKAPERVDLDELVVHFIKPFDLSEAPLFRVKLTEFEPGNFVLMCDMHHIISDGISIAILVKDFIELYEERQLPVLKLQYKDYAEWQNRMLESDIMKKQEEFWLDKFAGDIPVLHLPIDFRRPEKQTFIGDRIKFCLGSDLSQNVHKLALENGTTLYTVLFAAFNILLFIYTGQDDLVIGSPTAGRNHADSENLVGMFVNTLAIRSHPSRDKTVKDFIKEISNDLIQVFENQDYQFEKLVDKLNITRDLSRNPLFDVMFSLEDIEYPEADIRDFRIVPYDYKYETVKFDLELRATEVDGDINLILDYSKNLFIQETVERMSRHFIQIVKTMTEDIRIKLGAIDILSEYERKQLIFDFNNTQAEYNNEKTIKQLFEEQVEKHPNHTAVVFNGNRLSYGELNIKSNRLARLLIERGAKSRSVIGLLLKPSIEMVIALLGIIKAGAAYLPIDAEFPADRVNYMLSDSSAKLLLASGDLAQKVDFQGETIDLFDRDIYIGDGSNPENSIISDDPIYIIYTSGTTGLPKGVVIKNKGLVNYVTWFKKQSGLSVADKTVLLSSFAYDLGYTCIYPALLSGCELHLLQKEFYSVPENLSDYINSNKISFIKTTPSLFNVFVNSQNTAEHSNSLRFVVLGGEEINTTDVEKYHRLYPATEIMNHYGPTEATIGSAAYRIDFNTYERFKDKPVIGKPIDNVQIFILNQDLKPVPIGVAGEIFISGEGLAEGYLNQPGLSAQKFLRNPFSRDEKSRLYKTGDLGRYLQGGEIQFLGRTDNQVKIRGYRVEINEIESQLMKCNFVRDSVVATVRDMNSQPFLNAYVVAEKEASVSQIREQLRSRLPSYMMPANIIIMDHIPMTPNGKVDYKALPEPCVDYSDLPEFEAPENVIEQKLIEIWKEILGNRGFGVKSNFFEAGGHSLSATQMVSRIHKEFKVNMPLSEVFSAPTVREMAKYIKDTGETVYASIMPVPKADYYELSSAQKRLYLLNQLKGIGTSYNMPRVILVEGQLDLDRFEYVIKALVNRHEALRTSFVNINGEPKQHINGQVDIKVRYIDLNREFQITPEKIEDIEVTETIKEFIQPFDLAEAPLLRVEIIQLSGRKFILLLDMHHIISDGSSVNILIREFIELYNNKELPDLRIQYKDFSAWQNKFIQSDLVKKQEEYWLKVLAGELPILSMPTDFPRPAMQNFEGNSIRFDISKELEKGLNRLALHSGTTLFMVLMTAYNILLAKYSAQEDIIVGSPIAGRFHADLQNILGMFANTLAIRSYPSGSKSFLVFLHEVRDNLLKVYENQDYQFEMLLDKLNIKRDPSRNPLFSTMFALQSIRQNEERYDGISFMPLSYSHGISKFDISLFAACESDGIHFEMQYSTCLFRKETIERMAKHFITVLEAVTSDENVRINEIEIENFAYENPELDNVTFNF